MIARRMTSMLPPLAHDEALEVTRIHSSPGCATTAACVPAAIPGAAPHDVRRRPGRRWGDAAAGGAHAGPRRGAVPGRALGVRPAAAGGAAPAARGRSRVDRAGRPRRAFPTRTTLVAATNPCPCGRMAAACRCGRPTCPLRTQAVRAATGPDRPRRARRAADRRGPRAATRVTTSRSYADRCSRRASTRRRGACAATPSCAGRACAQRRRSPARRAPLLDRVYDHGDLSARGRDRALRVARTVADLEGAGRVDAAHLRVALAYRRQDEALAQVAA